MTNPGYIQTDLDLKFLVLYIMNRVAAPVSPDQLLELCLCDEGVNYFNFQQAAAHLVETEHLTLEEERYAITEKGRRNCQICAETLPFSVRRRCDENLLAVNEQLRRDAQIRGELLPREDSTFTVRLALDDDAGNLFTLELLTPSEEQGKALIDRFKTGPELMYSKLTDLLFSEA